MRFLESKPHRMRQVGKCFICYHPWTQQELDHPDAHVIIVGPMDIPVHKECY